MSAVLILAFLLLQSPQQKDSVILNVRHEHAIGNCEGTLTFSQEGIRYDTKDKNHSRSWSYPDVKYFEILSEHEIEIHSYESHGVERLGLDRDYTFPH